MKSFEDKSSNRTKDVYLNLIVTFIAFLIFMKYLYFLITGLFKNILQLLLCRLRKKVKFIEYFFDFLFIFFSFSLFSPLLPLSCPLAGLPSLTSGLDLRRLELNRPQHNGDLSEPHGFCGARSTATLSHYKTTLCRASDLHVALCVLHTFPLTNLDANWTWWLMIETFWHLSDLIAPTGLQIDLCLSLFDLQWRSIEETYRPLFSVVKNITTANFSSAPAILVPLWRLQIRSLT